MRGASSRSLVGRQRKCISCVCGALRRVQGAQPESEQMRKFSYPALILLLVSFSFSMSPVPKRAGAAQHLLYVASPGVRNYVEYGGVGILVFDVDKEYKFVRRIQTWSVPDGSKPENVKGIAAIATTGRVYLIPFTPIIGIVAGGE